MRKKSALICSSCQKIYPLSEILYSCQERDCKGLLDVWHDTDYWKNTPAKVWKNLLSSHSYSGVWNKKEWVLPDLDENDIVSLGEGNTPLVSLPSLAQKLGLGELWLKQCGISHSGSFKDLGMTVLVSHVKSLLAQGNNIRAIACASTGDTSAALASYASYAGIPTIVFLPAGRITTAQLIQPIANHSLVLSLQTDFDGCMKIVQEVTKDAGIYLANSMNPLRLEGQKTMGIEVLQQLHWEVPDWFIIPGGNLGNVSALVAGISLMKDLGLIKDLPKICVAQSKNANPLYLSYQNNFAEAVSIKAKKTLASAIQIGRPVSFLRAVRALRKVGGVVEQASEEELANASACLDIYGMFADPHTGVAFACLEKLCASGTIQKGESAVVVSTAHGLKFASSKTDYHNAKLDFPSRYRNIPIELEAESKKVLKILDKYL